MILTRKMSIEAEELLAKKYIDWMNTDGNLFAKDFWKEQGILPTWPGKVATRSPIWRKALQQANEIRAKKVEQQTGVKNYKFGPLKGCPAPPTAFKKNDPLRKNQVGYKKKFPQMGFQPGHKFLGGLKRSMTDEEDNQMADKLLAWIKEEGNVFYQDFLNQQDLDANWIKHARDRNPYVMKQYLKAKKIQEVKLMKGGLLDPRFNSGMARFILINRHAENWSEKTETKLTGTLEHTASIFLSNSDGKTKDLVDEEKI